MSFVMNALHAWSRGTGIGGYPASKKQNMAAIAAQPPGIPDPNNAANAALEQTDALRARRGFLGNIYGGASAQTPASGKTQLGT